MNKQIIVGLMQLIDTDQYVPVFQEELNKIGVLCKAEGLIQNDC